MRIWLKRNIIATLMICSYAISTSLFASTETERVKQAEIEVVPEENQEEMLPFDHEFNPASSGKQYLFDRDIPSWLNSTLETLEGFQVWLGGHVQHTSDEIDNYFGTDDSFDLTRGNRLDIRAPITIHDSGEVDMRVRFRAKLVLPKLRERWHVLVESERESESGVRDSRLSSDTTREKSKTTLALQALLNEAKGRELSFKVGIRTAGLLKPDPYVRLQKRFEFNLIDGWDSRMTHSLFWKRVDGPGIDSAVVFDRPIGKQYLFRAQSDGTWWHNEAYYDLLQRLLLYQTINQHRLFTYQTWMSFDSKQQHSFQKTGYGLAFNWRERAYKNWLYFEVEPGIKWVEDNQFSDPDISIMFMLEMRFFKLI